VSLEYYRGLASSDSTSFLLVMPTPKKKLLEASLLPRVTFYLVQTPHSHHLYFYHCANSKFKTIRSNPLERIQRKCIFAKMQFALAFRNEKVLSGACCNWMAQPAIRTLYGISATICPGKAGFRNGIAIQ
jgi:hypothetical protein